MKEVTISIDAMGGDHGSVVTVEASMQVLERHANLRLVLVGDTEAIQQQLTKLNAKDHPRITIQHTTQEVAMDEPPSQALRGKKDSSMRVAINLVKDGRAEACVSAGNTGALMATARFVLKTLPGIDRPAIIAAFPTTSGEKEVHVLDLGANVDSGAEHLYQFAVMGSVLVSAVDNIPHPSVGLLNIGEEEMKGNEQVKATAQLLSNNPNINYIGYVEGTDIFKGEVDVVVCDGFVGNIALKASEGTAKLIAQYAKEAFMRNWFTRLAALFARPALKRLSRRIDPSRRNGASFIGLNGIVIKSHGSANTFAFANAIEEAVLEVEKNIVDGIRQQVGMILDTSEV